MKFLSVRELRRRFSQAWKSLAEEQELVLTSNGRPIAILSSVSEETLEETLSAIRRARAVAAVTESQRRAAELGTNQITLEEIHREIEAVRAPSQLKRDFTTPAP